MPSKTSALLPSPLSILSAAAVIYLPYNFMWILIIVTGGISLLFEYLSPTIPNQLITPRVWFGTCCLKSASLLICLKVFLGIILSIQGHLERFTVEILKCIQLYQLVPLGFIGWLFLWGPKIYKFISSPKECENQGIGESANPPSPSESLIATNLEISLSTPMTGLNEGHGRDETILRSSPRLAKKTLTNMNEIEMARKSTWGMR